VKRRYHYAGIVCVVLLLTACATQGKFVAKSARTYKPCSSVELCIKTIHDVIKVNWVKPSAQMPGQVSGVMLHIELTDDAQIAIASVENGSGSADLDESALAAVYRAADFRELKGLDAETFEKNFRRFKLHFKPDNASKP
jgi:outer membrane biosynthesis protein TonB